MNSTLRFRLWVSGNCRGGLISHSMFVIPFIGVFDEPINLDIANRGSLAGAPYHVAEFPYDVTMSG